MREFYAEFTRDGDHCSPLLVHEQRGACLARACLEVLVDSRGRPSGGDADHFATLNFARRETHRRRMKQWEALRFGRVKHTGCTHR